LVDVLPTVCGLLGMDTPEGLHLDGSDLSPLLTNRDSAFTRHQPLFWIQPMSSKAAVAIRDGKYSMVGFREYQYPRDQDALNAVLNQMEEVLKKANSPELEPWVTRIDVFGVPFKNKEAQRLRSEYIRLYQFQESWIPTIKAGSFGRFELYDLEKDPGQQTDLSAQLPEVFARLKNRFLEIQASVMADGPDWD
jgi:arylsulfatase A